MSYRHARQPRRPTRCNYCRQSATVWLRYQGYLVTRASRGHFTLYAASCSEHEGCVNWQGVLALHPEAERITATPGRHL